MAWNIYNMESALNVYGKVMMNSTTPLDGGVVA